MEYVADETCPLTRLAQIEALLIVISEEGPCRDDEDICGGLRIIVEALEQVRRDLAICLEQEARFPGRN